MAWLSTITVLAYRPFLDPLPIEHAWPVLLIPLSIALAVVYKALKLGDLSKLPRQAAWLAAQVAVFMMLAALAVWLLGEVA